MDLGVAAAVMRLLLTVCTIGRVCQERPLAAVHFTLDTAGQIVPSIFSLGGERQRAANPHAAADRSKAAYGRVAAAWNP